MLHMNLEKEELYCNPAIFVAKSDVHRWGVFTDEDLKAFDVIQEAPYCTFPKKELKKADIISRYSYETDSTCDQIDDYLIGFGFAPLYNHDHENFNCAYEVDTVNEVIRHYALEDIKAGSELLIDYGCDEWEDDDDY